MSNTKTEIKLKKEKASFEISRGTFVKRENDLFIVSLIPSKEGYGHVDPIATAMFGSGNVKYSVSYEQKYALISISSGLSYFKNLEELSVLSHRIKTDGKFELVEKVKIFEI